MSTSAAAAQVQLTGWLAYLIALAVVVSALLSLLAVRFATRAAQRTREEASAAAAGAREEAARERRLQDELGVLTNLRSLIRPDSPEEDLPLLRVLEDVFPTELGERKHREIEEQVEGEGLAARGTRDSRRTRVVGREIEEAIDRRTAP